MTNKRQIYIKKRFVVNKTLGKISNTDNDQLETLRYDMKRLTLFTSRPNIALNNFNAVKFYSVCVLFSKGSFSARIITL